MSHKTCSSKYIQGKYMYHAVNNNNNKPGHGYCTCKGLLTLSDFSANGMKIVVGEASVTAKSSSFEIARDLMPMVNLLKLKLK